MKRMIHENGWTHSVLLALALVAGIAQSSQADLLVTGNGESLSGSATRVAGGVLVFRTSLEGQMMVPMTEIKSLSTDGAWIVTEADGTVHIGRFVPEGIAKHNESGDDSPVTSVPLGNVISAKPLPSAIEAAGADAADGSAWSTSARAGMRVFEGSTDGIEPHVALEAQGAGRSTDLALGLGFDVDGTDDFPSYFTGEFELLGNSAPSWAPFVQGLLERNTHEALRLRTGLTVGVRYSVAGVSGDRLEMLAGIGGSYGRWDPSFLAGELPFAGRGEETESVVNLHLGLRYSRHVWGGGTWAGQLSLMPGLTDADDFRAGAQSSLTYPVTSKLRLRLDMLLNYDDDRPLSALDNVDTSLGASIELDF